MKLIEELSRMVREVEELEERSNKIMDLARPWCRWNRKEINGDKFAIAVQGLFHKETDAAWRNYLKPV